MEKLYDDLIMDHIKNARNFGALDDANHKARGSNPLCGDDLTVYVKVEHDRIESIAFQCTCCGVSMASASIMTESLRGRRTAEAKLLIPEFVAVLNRRAEDPSTPLVDPGQTAILATVREFPARTRCAVLPWLALEAALDDRQDVVVER